MENGSNDQKSWWQPGLILFFRLSGWIGFPVIAALFVGKWLDEKYHSEPWLFLTTMAVAFVFSIFGIIKETTKEIKKIEQEAKLRKDAINKKEDKK